MDAISTNTWSQTLGSRVHASKSHWPSRPSLQFVRQRIRSSNTPLSCSKLFSLEAASPFAPAEDISSRSIIKGRKIIVPIDAEDAPEFAFPDREQEAVVDTEQHPLAQIQWPMWFLGPSALLVTGLAPTLWLPLSSVIQGPNIAGLLSLLGLDCIFNIGATLFLLMSDACAQPKGTRHRARSSHVPFNYKLWNLGASVLGVLAPSLMLLASHKGYLQPRLPFISFSVLLGPYLLLLSVQMLTEILTWHWKSPVWLLTPVVYEAYRVLQLMRGIGLGEEIGAPGWAVGGMRLLVSWWVFVLGVQLMRVAWFSPTVISNSNHELH